MANLKGTVVKRGGVTAHYWYETIRSVAIDADSELRISFSMASKGGGRTQVQLQIQPEDFSTIVEMMSVVNRQAAMEAMSTELARQIPLQSEQDAKVASEARSEIHQLARQKYYSKLDDDDHERIVSAGIGKLISEIESKKPE